MKKINLKTDEFKVKSSLGGTVSTTLGIIMLSFVVLSFGWVYWQKQKINQELKSTKEQITQKQLALDKTNFKEVYDFEERLVNLRAQMANYTNPVSSLTSIAAATLPETYFSTLEVVSNLNLDSYKGEIVVPDFSALARQINFYSELAIVDNFALETSSYAEEGIRAVISFNVHSGEATN